MAENLEKIKSEIIKLFDYDVKQMNDITEKLIEEMDHGLNFGPQSSLAMIPSFITSLPTGKEEGFAYALDVGGTNLRVLGIKLDGKGGIHIDDETQHLKLEISKEFQEGEGKTLFDLFGSSVEKVTNHGKLGVTFSFPVTQKSKNSGLLLRWTKGFSANGVVGNDVCELLTEALLNRKVNVNVAALINDTVGTLIAGSYLFPGKKCVIGLILGTGSNTCYFENISKMNKFRKENNIANFKKEDGMIINMESGNFGTTNRGTDLPLTEFDEILDAEAVNKGGQLLEKQISGMFLGELVRLVLRKYITNGTIFNSSQDAIKTAYSFETSVVSQIVADTTDDLTLTDQLLKENGIKESTKAERVFVKHVSFHIGKRAACLASIQIAAILRHTGQEKNAVVVCIDGSVFEKFTAFKENMYSCLKLLLGDNQVELELVKDGSGVGAALAAYVD